jgi:hypothetical protein
MQITPQKLSKAINVSFGKFDHARKNRGRYMAQMVGRFYGKTGSVRDKADSKASPINLLHSAITTLVPNLVYATPKVKVATNILAYRSYGDILELATNHLIDRIDLRMALRKSIYDAVFMAGFIKTGLASADQYVTLDGVTMEVGQPYAERVDPDDIILDPMARDWHEQAFIGNRFRTALSALEETGLYNMDELKKLAKWREKREASELIGAEDQDTRYNEVEEYVDLCEVYFPREQRIVTIPYQKEAVQDEFLREADYQGPDTGPYHMLGFTPVSDNILPVAPAAIWYDLHILGNRIARKLARQAERQKRVLAYDRTAAEDAEKIAEAEDGESIGVDNVDKVKEFTYGGASEDSYSWMEWVKRQFSEQAGNIDQLSGTGSNSPTATQAEMLQANTSVRLADMQNLVYGFTADVSRDLAFFLHTDPLIELPLVKRINGVETQVYYTPEMRRGEFFDFNFKIQPYSMARPDPNMSVRRKLEFATNVIPAAAQAAALLGPGFKVGPFLKQMAQEVNLDGAEEWLDDVAFQEWFMQKLQMATATGDPGKATADMSGMPTGGMGATPPGFNPGQPNPTAMGPNGGVSPQTETAQAQQETAGEIQGMRQPSAKAIALSR